MAKSPLSKRPKMPMELSGEDRGGDPSPWQGMRERSLQANCHFDLITFTIDWLKDAKILLLFSEKQCIEFILIVFLFLPVRGWNHQSRLGLYLKQPRLALEISVLHMKTWSNWLNTAVDPRFAKGGVQTMASARSANLYWGLGAEPPVGSRGSAPGGESGGESRPHRSWKLFAHFHRKDGPKYGKN